MNDAELEQLELLARIDELIDRLRRWVEPESPWEPMNHCRALVKRLLSRVETLRIRLEAPLVVATFGGTGTGKSTLVNALVGKECTTTGRQRPTTTRPVMIVHPDTEVDAFGIPLDDFDIVRVDAPLLQDIVLIDCPDPDTSEAETTGSNLERLHRLLPYCDVLIYTSTQQKYRSARVSDELGQAASGCRLLFVQTHAELDDDIRDDWRERLRAHYDVPELFFVDSERAFRDQQEGRRPGGDFRRLLDTLTSQLAASQRIVVRRANLLDLLHAALEHCRKHLARHSPPVEQLEAALDEQRQKLIGKMTRQLRQELLSSRNLWERRLLGSVTEKWGFSPFSSVLRLYNGLGNLIASMTFFRARTSAQMALLGAMQGARWISSRRQEKRSEDRLEELSTFSIDESALQETQFVLAGYVKSARLDPELIDADSRVTAASKGDGSTTQARQSSGSLRRETARVEEEFVNDAGQKVNRIIEDLSVRNTGFFTRTWYELLFLAYVGFVLFRVGKNFFYDSFLRQYFAENPPPPERLFTMDFWITAGVFFLLWCGLLVMAFTARLRRGLNRRINDLADELSQMRLSGGLFPALEDACREIDRQRHRLEAVSERVSELRSSMAAVPHLGAAKNPPPVPTQHSPSAASVQSPPAASGGTRLPADASDA